MLWQDLVSSDHETYTNSQHETVPINENGCCTSMRSSLVELLVAVIFIKDDKADDPVVGESWTVSVIRQIDMMTGLLEAMSS